MDNIFFNTFDENFFFKSVKKTYKSNKIKSLEFIRIYYKINIRIFLRKYIDNILLYSYINNKINVNDFIDIDNAIESNFKN